MEMVNPSPHAVGCKADAEPTLIGLAYFCPLYKRRLGFLPEKESERRFMQAMESMYKDIIKD